MPLAHLQKRASHFWNAEGLFAESVPLAALHGTPRTSLPRSSPRATDTGPKTSPLGLSTAESVSLGWFHAMSLEEASPLGCFMACATRGESPLGDLLACATRRRRPWVDSWHTPRVGVSLGLFHGTPYTEASPLGGFVALGRRSCRESRRGGRILPRNAPRVTDFTRFASPLHALMPPAQTPVQTPAQTCRSL